MIKRKLVTFFAVGIVFLLSQLSIDCLSEEKKKEKMPQETIEEVLAKYTDQWMSLPGVVGTGIGEEQRRPCIKVLVDSLTPELKKRIPDKVDGYLVVIEVTGEIKALDEK